MDFESSFDVLQMNCPKHTRDQHHSIKLKLMLCTMFDCDLDGADSIQGNMYHSHWAVDFD